MTPALLGVLLAAALIIGWILGQPLLAARRRQRLRRASIGEADRMLLRRRLPLYAVVPGSLRQRLDELIGVFIAEKEFVGCHGLDGHADDEADDRGAGLPAGARPRRTRV